MNRSFSVSPRARRIGARIALGAGLLATLAGVYAFRTLTARPGEGALRYVPSDAVVVASIDLSPSVSQTMAFKKIDDALARNGMNGMLEHSILDLFESGTAGIEGLKPLVLRNGAVAVLPGPNGGFEGATGVAMIALSDGAAAQAILAKNGADRYFKGTKYYKLRNGRSNMMIVDDLLLVGEKPEALYRVRQVATGAAPSITSDAMFTGARSHVADDANVMVFLSPKTFNEAPKELQGYTNDWMSMGIAIRDGGIGISYSGVVDLQRQPEMAVMAKTAPIRSDLFRVLPSGAYGTFVFSDPSNYFESFRATLGKDKDAKKAIAEMEDSLQKEVGMDFDKDVLPAFRGNVVFSAYPAEGTAGVDGLIVIDDSNDGDPAAAVDRFQNWVRRQIEKEGNQQGPLWTETKATNARMFRITDKNQDEMRKSMGQGMDDSQINREALVGKKTVAWAMVGKAVFASTSQELLDRAVANYQNPANGLDTDPKFAAHEKEVLNGSQQLIMISLSRIAEGVRNTIKSDKMDKEGRDVFNAVIDAFAKLENPLTIHGKLQPDGRMSGGAFIPLDYDKVLDFAGEMKNKH